MSIALRVAEVFQEIQSSCDRVKRDPKDVHLVAVSKFQSIESIKAAYDCGLRDFGENYLQELIQKREALADLKEIRWHLIGHLQTNKVKFALENADFFHALDSEKLISEISKRNKNVGRSKPWPVFIQVNLEKEATKSGVTLESLEKLIKMAEQESCLDLRGLMCIPEKKYNIGEMRPVFRQLAELAASYGLRQLSMGMSEDFGVAIEEGANWIRVGRKIFGDRPN